MTAHNLSTPLGVVGLGLIGGSLSLDLQALGYTIHGLVSRDTTAQRARERKLATVVSTDPGILLDCELVILAHPLKELLSPSTNLLKSLSPNSIVTDVASVKYPVLEKWQFLHPRFVPSHPMAGTDKSGVESGIQGLFISRPWIATPSNRTDPIALERVRQIAESLGSNWLVADAKIHDQAVALISHMPVFISTALLSVASEDMNPLTEALTQALASSGFADTTRIGAGEPHIGISMAQNNIDELIQSIEKYRRNLEKIENLIIKRDWMRLSQELKNNQGLRSKFL